MITHDAALQAQDNSYVLEQRQWEKMKSDIKNEHEEKMKNIESTTSVRLKELEVENSRLIHKTSNAIFARKEVVITILKVPALPFALLFMFILALINREIPDSLEEFLSL